MKKCLAIILTLAIFLCAAPLAGFTSINWPEIHFGPLFPTANAAETVASGDCGMIDEENGLDGSNLTWTLDSDGQLTIDGTGGMRSYSRTDHAPWFDHRGSIKTVVVKGGVLEVCSWAFYDCDAIREVVLQEGDVAVDDRAFYDAKGPFTIQLPRSLQFFSAYELRCASSFSVDPDNPYFTSKDSFLCFFTFFPPDLLSLSKI